MVRRETAGNMSFTELGLSESVLRAVSEAGYEQPTPIQKQAIPQVLMGRDLLGCAQTGTGKTAGFTLPMIDILGQGRAKARMPRSLILEPTRELAAQVEENFETYGKFTKLTTALLIGGVSFTEQFRKLDRGVDVLIATPGRLLDHVERGKVLMNDVSFLVIDEADRMLDMGFIPDVERIVSFITKKHQTLLFSATMPREIKRLADRFLKDPKEITVGAPSSVVDTVIQALAIVPARDKRAALRTLMHSQEITNALIFCNRKRDIGVLHRSLERHGFNAGALHGDMDQFSRTATLDKFKAGDIQMLVCSDVAARGLDIAAVSHVFNFDVPTHPEDYVHRIGRTGRAGRSGHAFTLAAPEDGKYVALIEKLAGKGIPRVNVAEIGGAELKEERGKGRGRGGTRRADKRTSEKSEKPARKQEEKQPVMAEKQQQQQPVEAEKQQQQQPVNAEKRDKKQAAKPEKQTKTGKDNKRGSRSGRDSIGDVPDYGDVPFGETDLVPAFLKRSATL
jgi:superfamily II DNA/RNA helicase